ncbi:hypothetical protein F2Q68_00032171 [Brassica cretica]|uniref:Uncharacterized protein n=1 Tax=Brassica cretica TaxID=69181 RepID=A0A8S9GBS7_BRACR|nr:hypothetical protein F2Q68_00032171 [Brassica cretica]
MQFNSKLGLSSFSKYETNIPSGIVRKRIDLPPCASTRLISSTKSGANRMIIPKAEILSLGTRLKVSSSVAAAALALVLFLCLEAAEEEPPPPEDILPTGRRMPVRKKREGIAVSARSAASSSTPTATEFRRASVHHCAAVTAISTGIGMEPYGSLENLLPKASKIFYIGSLRFSFGMNFHS